jgi:Rrf2 family transcriptional regulator, nitric oxide-sensitive transcriptional repressor
LTEGPLDLVECFNPERNTCPLIGVCKLSRALQEATRAFMAVLDDLTLADIAANRGDLLARIAPLEQGIVAPMRKAK